MSYRGPRFYRIRLLFPKSPSDGRIETFGRDAASAHEAAKRALNGRSPGDSVALEIIDDRYPANVLETIYYHAKDVNP